MNTNSNTYTIVYASIVVVLVAFLLAFVSSVLKERQNANVELDTKKQILSSLNVDFENADPAALYEEIIKEDMIIMGTDLGLCGIGRRQEHHFRRLFFASRRNPGSGCGNRPRKVQETFPWQTHNA